MRKGVLLTVALSICAVWNAAPAQAQVCNIPQDAVILRSGPNGCQEWVASHFCSGYGSPNTCGCPGYQTCCGHSIITYGTMRCGGSCAGCEPQDATKRRASGEAVSKRARHVRASAKAAAQTTVRPTRKCRPSRRVDEHASPHSILLCGSHGQLGNRSRQRFSQAYGAQPARTAGRAWYAPFS